MKILAASTLVAFMVYLLVLLPTFNISWKKTQEEIRDAILVVVGLGIVFIAPFGLALWAILELAK